MSAIFEDICETAAAKDYGPASLLFLIIKFFVKLVSNKLVDHLEKFGLFPIASMVSGLLIHPYIFWQFYLREILGLLVGLGLFKLEHLIYIIINFDRVWYIDLFHKLKSSSKVYGFIWYFFNNRWLGFLLNANPYKNN